MGIKIESYRRIIMEAAFHYKLKVKLTRYLSKDNIDFIVHEREFQNENPIFARKEVFNEYMDWVNDLYTGIGKANGYVNDKQARIDLQKFIQNSSVTINNENFEVNDPLEYGIGIYFVIDEPYNSLLDKLPQSVHEFYPHDKKGDEILIHGIGNTFDYNDPFILSDNLSVEILYYEHYEYDKGNYERYYDLYDAEIDIDKIHILDTPFDWSTLTQSYNKPIKTDYDYEIDQLKTIIKGGEGHQVEFKPTLVYNFSTKKGSLGVKYIIAKVICAFLNSNGGVLFIGVKDDGSIQGLETNDFSLCDKKAPKDFFQQELDKLIEYFFDFTIKPNLSGHFYNIYNKEIFVLKVTPMHSNPTFLSKRDDGVREFWVRGFAGNRHIKDLDRIEKYWKNREDTTE